MAEVSRVRVNLVVPLLALAAVALLALLAFNLRHLEPGAEELPPIPEIDQTPAGAVQEGSGNALRVLFVGVIATITLIAVVGSLLLWRRGVKLGKLLSPWEILGFALTIAFLVVALLFFNEVRQGLDAFVRWVTGTRDPGGSGGEGGNLPIPPGSTPPSAIVLIIVIVLLGVYLVAFAALFLPRLYSVVTAEAPDVGRPKRELARAVRRAIADLEAGEDFRAAVLRCYRSMVLLFEQRGLRPEASQTAREFQAAALRSIGVPREGVSDLTSLFEEARYSEHAIGEAQRDAALESLRAVRAGLEAPS